MKRTGTIVLTIIGVILPSYIAIAEVPSNRIEFKNTCPYKVKGQHAEVRIYNQNDDVMAAFLSVAFIEPEKTKQLAVWSGHEYKAKITYAPDDYKMVTNWLYKIKGGQYHHTC